MRVVGLDVGGAHVKAADTDGLAVSQAFPIWREPERLEAVLREVVGNFAAFDLLAFTTTAELADCFRTKAEGVEHVLDAMVAVAEARGAKVAVWQTGGEFVTPADARRFPRLVAAANWHAQATWLGRLVPRGRALLVDCGSTTTDLVPIRDGLPDPQGLVDVERLVSGELVYTGAGRTPVFHVCRDVAVDDVRCPLVPESFATMRDVYLVLGEVDEDPDDRDTANGRPATREHALERLARTVCCDTTELSEVTLVSFATQAADAHVEQLESAVQRIDATSGPFDEILVSGSGSFVANKALDRVGRLASLPRSEICQLFDEATATAACARAVAELAVERRADLIW